MTWVQNIPEWLVASAPFVTHANRRREDPPDGPRYTLSMQRLLEILIPVLLSGVLFVGSTIAILGERMESCKENVTRLERSVDRIQSDLYGPRWQPQRMHGQRGEGLWI